MTTDPEPAADPASRRPWGGALRRPPAAFLAAVRFLTRVPVPDALVAPGEEPAVVLRDAVAYFPLAGAAIGLATAVVIVGAGRLWPPGLAVLLGLAFEAALTGALHEDAVADFCDAFGGGWSREEILRILKDSRVGSFGALGLTAAVLLRAGGLAALGPGQLVAATVASATLGRWVMLVAMATLPPVPGRAGLARVMGERLGVRGVLLGSLLALPGVLAWGLADPPRCAAAVTALLLFAFLFAAYVRRRLGGVTGDCLGCACYAGQIIVLLAAAARFP